MPIRKIIIRDLFSNFSMQLIKWEPFKEIDQFIENSIFPAFKVGFDLAVDVYEESGHIIAKMSLPGIKKEDFDISLDDDMMTISGRREDEIEVDKKDYYSKEIRRGAFSRTVSLPKSVDASRAEAQYENGELIVTMPVIEGAKEKIVKVKVKD